MMGRLGHRGPDGNGYYRDRRAALGHTRLAIIDTSGGAQPLCNEDGTVWVTFNGEIFNYVELREELRHRGHIFRTASDTEVIVHAWEEWGEECFARFNGQWAIALWDRRAERLVLSRDRLGVRPLFYHPAADGPAVRVRGEVHLRRPLGGARLRPRRSRPDLHLLVAGRAPHGVPRHRAARAGALRRPGPGRVPEGSLLAHHVPRAGPRARAGRPGERRALFGSGSSRRPACGSCAATSRLGRTCRVVSTRPSRPPSSRATPTPPCTRSRCASPTASSTRGTTRRRCPRCSARSTRTSW